MDRTRAERPKRRTAEGGLYWGAPSNEPHYFPGPEEKTVDEILANAKSAMHSAGVFAGDKKTYVVIPGRGTYPIGADTTPADLDMIDNQAVEKLVEGLTDLRLNASQARRVMFFAKSLKENV